MKVSITPTNNNLTSYGFTLLELLITLSLIGILTATALPYFKEYKQRGYDTRAQVDLRSIALAEEAYYIDEEKYLSCINAQCADLPGVSRISDGVTITVDATDETFVVTASHSKGTGKIFTWDSENGGYVP